LQGLVGGYLAEAQGEPKAVAGAVRDHYKPVGQGDDVPTAPVTVAVSFADKLDTLLSFFAINAPPTGSKDPFALRRAALGVLQLLIGGSLRPRLTRVLENHYDLVFRDIQKADLLAKQEASPGGSIAQGFGHVGDPRTKLPRNLLEFLADRLKVQQRDAGVRHDLIDSVFALGGEDDLVRLLARVQALQAFVETADGANLLAAYKRAANILKKEEGSWSADQVGSGELPSEEARLVAALNEAEPRAVSSVEVENFRAAMSALATLRQPIDAFFDKVTVNDPDPAVRSRRLNLLSRFRDAVHRVADFSKIEG
jgi:glycyl-tRNA synthetase beta chain